jgi:uncharacterized protein YjcR
MRKAVNTQGISKESLERQAQAILKMAEETGLINNYFFVTTFERYRTQMEVLEQLKEEIHKKELVVSKEYIKGKENLYSNPAIVAYNRTTDSANKTVATLLRILKSFDAESSQNESDPLLEMLNGGDADGEQ